MYKIKNSKYNKSRTGIISTLHGDIEFPAFLPDATYGTIHNLNFNEVKKCGIEEIVTTTLHIEKKIGSKFLKKFGGFHKFTGWNRPVLTDSGGYQVFSLIFRTNNKENKITESGCSFIDYTTGSYNFLTPEISQVIQSNIGSDIRLVLDIPINENSSLSLIKKSVERNTRWAKRSKEMFLKINNISESDFNNIKIKRPFLAAVIQGANNLKYRKLSAKQLTDIGFDIYCFGGLPLHNKLSWKVSAPKGFYSELIEYVGDLIPKDKIRYGMGIGTPDDLETAVKSGWDIFDSVLPTRNARHGYLYVSKGNGDTSYNTYDVLHIKNSRFKFDENPIDPNCSCEACKNYTRAYLRYLLKIKNSAGQRLATIHNLTFYANLMKFLRKIV